MLKVEVRLPVNNGTKPEPRDVSWQRSLSDQDISIENPNRVMQKRAIAQVLGAIFNEG